MNLKENLKLRNLQIEDLIALSHHDILTQDEVRALLDLEPLPRPKKKPLWEKCENPFTIKSDDLVVGENISFSQAVELMNTGKAEINLI